MGLTLLDLAEVADARGQSERTQQLLEEARDEFEQSLLVDSEDVTAHANLAAIYKRLGDEAKAEFHSKAHVRYKPDDNAADVARPVARRKYPAADLAAESPVLYWLHRPGAHQLPVESAIEPPERITAPESRVPDATGPRDDFGLPLDTDKVTTNLNNETNLNIANVNEESANE